MPWISSWRSTGSTPSLKLTNYATPKTYDWLPSPTDEPLPLIPKLPPRNPNTKPLIEGLPISPSPEDIFAQDEILQNRPKFSADVFKRKLYELEELCQVFNIFYLSHFVYIPEWSFFFIKFKFQNLCFFN